MMARSSPTTSRRIRATPPPGTAGFSDKKECTLDPEIPKESAVCNGEEIIYNLPNNADTREQPVTTQAPPRRSTIIARIVFPCYLFYIY